MPNLTKEFARSWGGQRSWDATRIIYEPTRPGNLALGERIADLSPRLFQVYSDGDIPTPGQVLVADAGWYSGCRESLID